MLLRVSGADFQAAVTDMVGNGKCSINFTVEDDMLLLQSSGGVYVDKRLKILSLEGESNPITVTLDSAVTLLSENYVVDISIQKDVLTIRQGAFEYNASREPEERVNTGAFERQRISSVSKHQLTQLLSIVRSFETVGRELAVPPATLFIINKTAYVKYSNSMYMQHIDLPDMAIPGEAVQKLLTLVLMVKDSYCKYSREDGIFTVEINKDTCVTVNTISLDKSVLGIVDRINSSLKELTSVNINEYDTTIRKICSTYKKILIEVAVCDGGLWFYVDNTKTKFFAGSSKEALLRIQMSTAQMSMISRIFGSDECSVWKGDNAICLRQKNSMQQLVIAGICY